MVEAALLLWCLWWVHALPCNSHGSFLVCRASVISCFISHLTLPLSLHCTVQQTQTLHQGLRTIQFSTLKVHIYNFVSWTHSLEKFLPWTFSHLLHIILHPYHQSFPWQSIPTASVILSWGIYYTFASNSTCQWFWLGALRMWCGGFIAGHVPAWGALVAL